MPSTLNTSFCNCQDWSSPFGSSGSWLVQPLSSFNGWRQGRPSKWVRVPPQKKNRWEIIWELANSTRRWLGGGFKHFLCSSLFGEMIQFDSYFSDGLKPPTIWEFETWELFGKTMLALKLVRHELLFQYCIKIMSFYWYHLLGETAQVITSSHWTAIPRASSSRSQYSEHAHPHALSI